MFHIILTTVIASTYLQNVSSPTVEANTPLQFTVTHDGQIGDSLDGRVYVMLTQGKVPPVAGPDWWNPEPFFAIDVEGWSAGEPLLIDDSADSMGTPLSSIEEGNWKAVAVFRGENERAYLAVQGGLFSENVEFQGDGSSAGIVTLSLTQKVPNRTWKEHKNLRLLDKKSPLLSDFYGRDINHGACVIVPDDYNQEREEPYPVLYWIGGFGSDHYGARMMKAYFTASDYDDQICRVILNAQTHSGHHAFADSANNGPRMKALIEEFIPYLEETYNLGGSGEFRFLSGHSSGGWSSLWLQIQNPDFFNGAWSLAPDPVDFHYFQTVDLYAEDANMYEDEEGNERPLARNGVTPILFTRGFTAMDDVIKDGGQMGSFEWVFSPRGIDGRPIPMWDHNSGEVNSEIVEYWKMYDIRTYLEDNWETLAPKLVNKINIIAAEYDTFYLEDAVIALNEFFEAKGFDAMIRIIENGNHGSVFRTSVIRDIDDYIAEKLQLTNYQNKKTTPSK